MNAINYNPEMSHEQQYACTDYTEVATETQIIDEEYIQSLYEYAADLMVNQDYDQDETINALMEKGVDFNNAVTITKELQDVISEEKSGEAGTDIVMGLVFAIGGLLLSMNTNYIFYGAVIYGAIRFFKGLCEL